jgi:hypothetical protein
MSSDKWIMKEIEVGRGMEKRVWQLISVVTVIRLERLQKTTTDQDS